MSKELSKVNSSSIYKSRFEEYGKIYIDSIPEPPVEANGGTSGANTASVKRQALYNDKSNQNHKVSLGGNNAT